MSHFEISISDEQGLREDREARTASFFACDATVLVTEKLISEIREYSLSRGGVNARVCLHQDPLAPFHEMIILEMRTVYFKPHKHVAKHESRHIIEGRMAMYVFSEEGEVMDTAVLGDGGNVIYRIGPNCYHVGVPLSEYVIYHEAKPGPFIREGDSIFAPWAPDGDNPAEVARYMDMLLSHLES